MAKINAHSAFTLPEALKIMGWADTREGQDKIVESLLDGQDTLAVMPTGAGKSGAFQLPALCKPGVCVVFSPLISLMKDQVQNLQARGVPAEFLNSAMTPSAQNAVETKLRDGELKFIYCAPERLNRPGFSGMLQALPISYIVIDEAHVIDDWEQDFRPAYAKIKEVIEKTNHVAVIAATATAGPSTIRTIKKSLGISFDAAHVVAPDRPNLNFEIYHGNPLTAIESLLSRASGVRGIIYCNTVKDVDMYYEYLTARRSMKNIGKYHGQMSPKQRDNAQNDFAARKTTTMIATNAFGLGIDYPDIRFILHTSISLTLESFAQEAGRAGRDGKPSYCLLCVPPDFQRIPKWMLQAKNPSIEQIKAVFNYYKCHKESIIRDTIDDVAQEVFGNKSTSQIVAASRAILKRHELISSWKEKPKPKRIRVVKDANTQAIIQGGERARANVLKVFNALVKWGVKNENGEIETRDEELAALTNFSEGTVNKHLGTLNDIGCITLRTERRFTCTRVVKNDFWVNEEELNEKRDNDFRKFTAMVEYASRPNTTTSEECRRFINNYFADTETQLQKAIRESKTSKKQYVPLW